MFVCDSVYSVIGVTLYREEMDRMTLEMQVMAACQRSSQWGWALELLAAADCSVGSNKVLKNTVISSCERARRLELEM